MNEITYTLKRYNILKAASTCAKAKDVLMTLIPEAFEGWNHDDFGVSGFFKADADYNLFSNKSMDLRAAQYEDQIALNFGPGTTPGEEKQENFFTVWVHKETAKNICRAIKEIIKD